MDGRTEGQKNGRTDGWTYSTTNGFVFSRNEILKRFFYKSYEIEFIFAIGVVCSRMYQLVIVGYQFGVICGPSLFRTVVFSGIRIKAKSGCIDDRFFQTILSPHYEFISARLYAHLYNAIIQTSTLNDPELVFSISYMHTSCFIAGSETHGIQTILGIKYFSTQKDDHLRPSEKPLESCFIDYRY